jgi:signal transduction histidine kinase
MVGVNMDVTDIKQAEIALQQALQREKELNELKSRFVSTTSHQFRTPLAAILANTETLTEYRGRMNPDQIEIRLDRIRKQVGHMQSLIEDVLNLSRIQANDVRYNPTQTDLDGLCREVIETFDQQAAYQGRVRYTVSMSPLHLPLDASLIHHVLNNLIHNALKYSSEDQPVIVDITHDDATVTVTVQDHGVGIPEADQAAIFEPFHRATNVEAIAGTGLGLSIVQQAVRLHQGEIYVTSRPDVGTTFEITLPLSTESE